MPIPYWTIGCIYGASAVTFGAFGAHGLKKRISDPAKIANFATAAHYQVPPQAPRNPYQILTSVFPAPPFRRPSPQHSGSTQEYSSSGIVRGWYDDV
jgi:hypothetical protein